MDAAGEDLSQDKHTSYRSIFICLLQILQMMGITHATIRNHRAERSHEKENTHVVDYPRDPAAPMAARLFEKKQCVSYRSGSRVNIVFAWLPAIEQAN